jgi:tetratricopeptide (TPR) repeat protein
MLIGLFVFTTAVSLAQEASERYLEVRGISELEMQPLAKATANLYEGTNKVESIQTASDGRFSFRLEINKVYTIEIEKAGLVSKRISFNTTMPDEEKGSWMNEFSIGLVKNCEGVDYSALKEPVDKVKFDPKRREYVSDRDYVNSMRPRIEKILVSYDECMMNKYDAAIRKGDQAFGSNDTEAALAAYREALEIYPRETYPSRQISAINSQLNRQEKSNQQAQAQAQQNELLARQAVDDNYNQALAKASVAYTRKDYTTARQFYQEALKIKPAESAPRTRLGEIESILAKKAAEDAKIREVENAYRAGIEKGDSLMKARNYTAAREQYAKASAIKPAEGYPKTKTLEIDRIEETAVRMAENAKKEAAENEYQTILNTADAHFKAKQYDEAKAGYAKALAMKPTDPYPAQRAKAVENTVAAEQAAMQKATNEGYAEAIAAGNNALANNQFPLAKTHYQKALAIKPSDPYANAKIEETGKLSEAFESQKAQEEKTAAQYKSIVTTADNYYVTKEFTRARETYSQALSIKPGDAYAQSRINAIDKATAAEQAAKTKVAEDGYKTAIAAANTAVAQHSFVQAKEYFQKALDYKSGDAMATGKLAEMDNLIAEQKKLQEQEAQNLNQYREKIASADKLFISGDLVAAKEAYATAQQFKPGDAYCHQKIQAIDNAMAAEKIARQKKTDEAYASSMAKGTSLLSSGEYSQAISAFEQALAAKPADPTAMARISEAESRVRQDQEKKAAEQAQKMKYDDLKATADQLFSKGDYSGARQTYEQALLVMPAELYPRQKLDEIGGIIREKERVLAEKQAAENAYNLALVSGDKYFKAKDFTKSKEEYTRALTLKPGETFPATRIAEIEVLMAKRQQEQAAAKARVDAYTMAMNNGNKQFTARDYETASASYSEALKQMPEDKLAREQLDKALYLMAEQEKLQQAEAAKKASYQAVITSADNAYNAANYQGARGEYQKALAIDPGSAYAKQRIAKIDEITRALAGTNPSSPASAAGQTKVAAAIPMGELVFRTESERQRYLEELKKKYPDGITLEKYREKYKEIMRFIIVRENQAQEFRQVKFLTYSGMEYSMNGKPITQQYFNSQVRTRTGEKFQEIEMQ